MKIALIIIGAVIGAIILFLVIPFFFISRVVFKEAYFNNEKNDNNKSKFLLGPQYQPYQELIKENVDKAASYKFEEVYATSFDGLKLYGRIYRFADNNLVQIQFHGYKGSGRRDMCGFLENAKENGINCIVVDHRAHGKSDGNIVSYGINERKDVLTWVEVAKQQFGPDCKIVIRGLSMGAATVLSSLDLDLPSNVKCVIADCPFSSALDETLMIALREKTKFPAPIATFMLEASAKLWGHFKLTETSPVEAVKKAKIPVLLIHGDDDRFVPHSMSEKIYANNNGTIQFETFPGAGHALSYFVDTERYKRIVKQFIDENLK